MDLPWNGSSQHLKIYFLQMEQEPKKQKLDPDQAIMTTSIPGA